jgi:hypothetical protein
VVGHTKGSVERSRAAWDSLEGQGKAWPALRPGRSREAASAAYRGEKRGRPYDLAEKQSYLFKVAFRDIMECKIGLTRLLSRYVLALHI